MPGSGTCGSVERCLHPGHLHPDPADPLALRAYRSRKARSPPMPRSTPATRPRCPRRARPTAGLLALAGLALLQGLTMTDSEASRTGTPGTSSPSSVEARNRMTATTTYGRSRRQTGPRRRRARRTASRRWRRSRRPRRSALVRSRGGVSRLPADELDHTEGPQPVLDREPVPDRAGPRRPAPADDSPAPRPQRLVAGDEAPRRPLGSARRGAAAWATIRSPRETMPPAVRHWPRPATHEMGCAGSGCRDRGMAGVA